MKYNPKVNEEVARMVGFAQVHPYTPEDLSQGVLRLMFELQGFSRRGHGHRIMSPFNQPLGLTVN